MQLKRTFLLGVIGSLSFSALLGIYAFLFGNFGDTEFKIIMTTLTAALFSLTSLGAAVVIERGRWRIAMIAAFVLSAVGLVVYLAMIWFEPNWRWEWWEFMVKSMLLLATWSIGLPHAGLLSLPTFKGFYLLVKRAAYFVVLILASLITVCILVEGDEEVWARVIGVFGILTALGTITVPILSKVAGIEKDAAVESTDLAVRITCPRCLLDQTVQTGHSRCSGCKLRFEIRIEEPRCPRCDYLLHKLTAPVCPECGLELGAEEVVTTPDGPAPEVNHDAEPNQPEG